MAMKNNSNSRLVGAGAGERIAYGAGVKGAFIDIEIIIERAGLRAASALCKLRACQTIGALPPPPLFLELERRGRGDERQRKRSGGFIYDRRKGRGVVDVSLGNP